jgi:hypothetical protein
LTSSIADPAGSDTVNGRAIDANVHVGGTKDPLHLRLVGVHTPKDYGFFLTNLPLRIGPRQVADPYQTRWAVELRSELDKATHRPDQIDAERPRPMQPLLHASLIASMLAVRLSPPTMCRPVRLRKEDSNHGPWYRTFHLARSGHNQGRLGLEMAGQRFRVQPPRCPPSGYSIRPTIAIWSWSGSSCWWTSR